MHDYISLQIPCVARTAKLLQSYLTLCNPLDHSPPVSSVHGILQARIQDWVAISFSRGTSPPGGSNRNLLRLLHWQAVSANRLPWWLSGRVCLPMQETHVRSLRRGRPPGEEHGNRLQYSCLENSKDRGAWQARAYGVAKSQTQMTINSNEYVKCRGGRISLCRYLFAQIHRKYCLGEC